MHAITVTNEIQTSRSPMQHLLPLKDDCRLSRLALELKWNISARLSPPDAMRLAHTNREFYKIIIENTHFWKRWYLERYATNLELDTELPRLLSTSVQANMIDMENKPASAWFYICLRRVLLENRWRSGLANTNSVEVSILRDELDKLSQPYSPFEAPEIYTNSDYTAITTRQRIFVHKRGTNTWKEVYIARDDDVYARNHNSDSCTNVSAADSSLPRKFQLFGAIQLRGSYLLAYAWLNGQHYELYIWNLNRIDFEHADNPDASLNDTHPDDRYPETHYNANMVTLAGNYLVIKRDTVPGEQRSAIVYNLLSDQGPLPDILKTHASYSNTSDSTDHNVEIDFRKERQKATVHQLLYADNSKTMTIQSKKRLPEPIIVSLLISNSGSVPSLHISAASLKFVNSEKQLVWRPPVTIPLPEACRSVPIFVIGRNENELVLCCHRSNYVNRNDRHFLLCCSLLNGGSRIWHQNIQGGITQLVSLCSVNRLVVALATGQIRLLNLTTGESFMEIALPQAQTMTLHNVLGSFIVVTTLTDASGQLNIRFIDTDDGKTLWKKEIDGNKSLSPTKTPYSVSIAACATRIVAYRSSDNRILEIDFDCGSA
jgi:hypothetical protein